MAWLEDFADEFNTTVIITGQGSISSFDSSNRPVYGTGLEKYNGLAAVWQLSASEILSLDRINNPSTHQVVIDPAKITGTLSASDTMTATINGVSEEFRLYMPDNILAMGDVMVLTAEKKVVT